MLTIPFETYLARALQDPEVKRQFLIEGIRLDIAVALVQAREEAQLSQEELAQRSGVSLHMIQRIERGSVNSSLGTLERLADAMGKHVHITIS